jgi:flavin-dependent dehydrogenase
VIDPESRGREPAWRTRAAPCYPPAVHDVVVVGGSLAGAATAIHLARAGRSVILLERNASYRRKACGEGLFPHGVRELANLRVLDEVQRHAGRLKGVRFNARGAMAIARLGGEGQPGLGVRRELLDPLILARAEAEGVEVRRGVAARSLIIEGGRATGVRTSAGNVAASLVVAADGLHSRLRRQAGLESRRRGDRYGVSAHLLLPAEPEPLVDVFFEDGYELYITPVGGRIVNAACLLRRAGMRRFAGDLAREYVRLLAAHRASPAGFRVVDEPVAAGPFAVGCRRAWRANVVLVGDAAGFFDGISGEGMSVALASARDCAAAIDAFFGDGNDDHFRAYDARRRALVRNSNLLSRVSLALGSRPALANLAVRNLGRRPETFTKLTAINTGELGLGALRPGDLSALLLGV